MSLIKSIDIADERETARLAGQLAPLLERGDVVALKGPLGSGKTSFARALLRARGVDGDIPSPTFALIQIYELDPPLWHCDLYRIEDPAEAEELGLTEAFQSAITLLEWPERLGEDEPADALQLGFAFAHDAKARVLRISGNAAWHARLKEACAA